MVVTRKNPGQLSVELLENLSGRGDIVRFARGEMLMTEGEVATSLHILLAGQLKVFTRDPKGRELIYNILEPGEFFGEMFLDGGPRSASVKAIVDSRCVVVGQTQLRSFMAAYPEFAECLVQTLIERLRHATAQIKGLALDGVYERTIVLLDQVAITDGEQRLVPPTLTQQEIADRVGATREMVNLIFRALTRGGFLSKDKRRRTLIIKDLPKHW